MDNKKIIYITSIIVILNAQINFLSEERIGHKHDSLSDSLEEFIGSIRIMDSSSDSNSSLGIRLIPFNY